MPGYPGDPGTAHQLRHLQASQDKARLTTRANKRPFQEQALSAYAEKAQALDRWMPDEHTGDGNAPAIDRISISVYFCIKAQT